MERVVTQSETAAKIVYERINSSESGLANALKRYAELNKQVEERDKLSVNPDLAAELSARTEELSKELAALLSRGEETRKMNENILP